MSQTLDKKLVIVWDDRSWFHGSLFDVASQLAATHMASNTAVSGNQDLAKVIYVNEPLLATAAAVQ